MVMSGYDAQHLQDVLIQVIDGCRTAWVSKKPWTLEDIPDIYEDLGQRIRALKALENEVYALDLIGKQEPILVEYISAVRSIPEKLAGKIDTYRNQRESQPDISESDFFRLYCTQDQHEFNGLLCATLVGTNDAAQGLRGYIDVERGEKTRQELRLEAVEQARDWVEHLDNRIQIPNKSSMEISKGHFAILEAASTILENYGHGDLRFDTLIGVPAGHPNTWKVMESRISRLMEYSKQIYAKFDRLKFLKGLSSRTLRPLDRLCGPEMSVIALREEVIKVLEEGQRIQKEFENGTRKSLYEMS
jgi:hypothetical protein